MAKSKLFSLFLPILCLFLTGCFDSRVKRDLILGREFKPQAYSVLVVINLDPQIQFFQYVEAELLKKGYKVKEGGAAGLLLRKEGLLKEGSLDPQALTKIGDLLRVQGIVLCSVLEFSRFRDSYRLSIKCVAPNTGETLWYAEGAKEGKRGQKSSELLKEIVIASLRDFPLLP